MPSLFNCTEEPCLCIPIRFSPEAQNCQPRWLSEVFWEFGGNRITPFNSCSFKVMILVLLCFCACFYSYTTLLSDQFISEIGWVCFLNISQRTHCHVILGIKETVKIIWSSPSYFYRWGWCWKKLSYLFKIILVVQWFPALAELWSHL